MHAVPAPGNQAGDSRRHINASTASNSHTNGDTESDFNDAAEL